MYRPLTLFVTLALFLANNFSFSLYAQESNEKKALILVHPTVANLQRFQALIEMNVFPLPTDYQILGLYHQQEGYDYALSEAFLKQNPGVRQISLMSLDCSLAVEDVFNEGNPCSAAYRKLFELSSGIIFPGGPDFLPAIYQARQDLLSVVSDPYRSIWESSLMFHLLGGGRDPGFSGLLQHKPEYVVLGICLGMQTMNVACGGSLIQDIPSKLYGLQTVEDVLTLPAENKHRNYWRDYNLDQDIGWYHFHPVQLTRNSVLSQIAGGLHASPQVLSSHHQCIDLLGKELEVYATSVDGRIIEAIGHTRYPHVLGVQFHPEIPELYRHIASFQQLTGQPGVIYHEEFPGELGTDFHINFWLMLASWFGNGAME